MFPMTTQAYNISLKKVLSNKYNPKQSCERLRARLQNLRLPATNPATAANWRPLVAARGIRRCHSPRVWGHPKSHAFEPTNCDRRGARPIAAPAPAVEAGGAAVSTPPPSNPEARSPVDASPGSGKADSWDSNSPGSPGTLGERSRRPYDPYQETYEQYETRLWRQAEILESHQKK